MQRTKIKCKYCGREISKSNISKHTRSHENGNFDKYLNAYKLDHDDLFCKFCGKECKHKNSLVQHEIRCIKNPNAKRNFNTIVGFNNIGRAAWNKGLTKDTDYRMQKVSETFKKNKQLGLYKSPIVKNKKKWITNLSKAMKKAYSKPILRKHPRYKQGFYKGIWCDSSWELAYVVYMLDNNMPITRNTKGFKYTYGENEHTYFPDFYLTDKDLYIEIKGYETEKDLIKYKSVENLQVIKHDDIVPILYYVRNKYGNNFADLLYD